MAPAGSDRGVLTTYSWATDEGGLVLRVDVEPKGEWPAAAAVGPSDGTAARTSATVEWFGRGPGEAYVDSIRRPGWVATG